MFISQIQGLCDAAQPPIEVVTDKAVEPGATLSVLWSRPQPRKRIASGVSVVVLQGPFCWSQFTICIKFSHPFISDDLPETTASNFHESVRRLESFSPVSSSHTVAFVVARGNSEKCQALFAHDVLLRIFRIEFIAFCFMLRSNLDCLTTGGLTADYLVLLSKS